MAMMSRREVTLEVSGEEYEHTFMARQQEEGQNHNVITQGHIFGILEGH